MTATLAELDVRSAELKNLADDSATVLAAQLATATSALDTANASNLTNAAVLATEAANLAIAAADAATETANLSAVNAENLINLAVLATQYVPPPLPLSYGTPFHQVLPNDGTSWATTSLAANTIPDDQKALICVFTRSATATYTIDALTYGGVSLSPIAQDNVNGQRINWYVAPAGVDGEVVFTTSASCVRSMVIVWPLSDLVSSTPVGTAGASTTTSTVNLTVAADGAAFGFSNGTALGTVTWTGLTEQYDGYIETNTNATSYAAVQTTVDGTLAVKALQTGSPAVFRMSCISLR